MGTSPVQVIPRYAAQCNFVFGTFNYERSALSKRNETFSSNEEKNVYSSDILSESGKRKGYFVLYDGV